MQRKWQIYTPGDLLSESQKRAQKKTSREHGR